MPQARKRQPKPKQEVSSLPDTLSAFDLRMLKEVRAQHEEAQRAIAPIVAVYNHEMTRLQQMYRLDGSEPIDLETGKITRTKEA